MFALKYKVSKRGTPVAENCVSLLLDNSRYDSTGRLLTVIAVKLLLKAKTEFKYSEAPRFSDVNLFVSTSSDTNVVRADTSNAVRRLPLRIRSLRTGRFDVVKFVIQLLFAVTVVRFGNPERAKDPNRLSRTFKDVRLGKVPIVSEVRRF